jgi:hypothetical protein
MGSSRRDLRFELAASNCLPACSIPEPSPVDCRCRSRCERDLPLRPVIPASLAAFLSRSEGSWPVGCDGKTNKGMAVSDDAISDASLCSRRRRSASCSDDIGGIGGARVLVSVCVPRWRWNRSIALYNSPDGLISVPDAALLSSISRTNRSAVSWSEWVAGGSSELPDCILN